ncbi:hypothetical protein ES332_D08G139200v1 [Gossypium tomentosum]|uniref:Uncharacterized protein n=1 Tax=Gossypium tomentosum TaxID=34277 RepID=A0A5D2JWH2_GOSTO|nr:hypothetical protein ES332_D08G139200v1 [Gossypium tomentosum]
MRWPKKGKSPIWLFKPPYTQIWVQILQKYQQKASKNHETFRFPATDPRGCLPRPFHVFP